ATGRTQWRAISCWAAPRSPRPTDVAECAGLACVRYSALAAAEQDSFAQRAKRCNWEYEPLNESRSTSPAIPATFPDEVYCQMEWYGQAGNGLGDDPQFAIINGFVSLNAPEFPVQVFHQFVVV